MEHRSRQYIPVDPLDDDGKREGKQMWLHPQVQLKSVQIVDKIQASELDTRI